MAEKWQQWMPLHIDRWRGSPAVRAMHPSARSGYLDLILSQWQSDSCSLPSDPIELADLSCLGDELWAAHGSRILRNFDILPDGKLRNQVCYSEWLKQKAIAESRRESWYRNRPWVIRRSKRVRRSISKLQRLSFLNGKCCARCGSSGDLQVDHIVPLARGGKDNLSNWQPLCGTCNRRKGSRLESEVAYANH